MRVLNFLVLILLVSCASRGPDLKKLHLTSDKKILKVPFISQKKYHCGPASLRMVMGFLDHWPDEKLVRKQSFTPGKIGSLTYDVSGAARRQGFLAIPVRDFSRLLKEVSSDRPLIVFQNLGLSWFPQWHFAVVIGYDLDRKELILHSGQEKRTRMKFSTFLNTWERGGNWALLLDRPENISPYATELEVAKAAASLEQSGLNEKALVAYQGMLERWHESYVSLIGIGNINFQKENYKEAKAYFLRALRKNPQEAYGWHNLAIVQWKLGEIPEAKVSADKALELATSEDLIHIRQNIAEITLGN